MADSIAKRIIQALESRLQSIVISGGFNTDAGLSVHGGVPVLDESVLLPLLILPLPEERGDRETSGRYLNIMRAPVICLINAATDEAYNGQDLLADIKTAVLLPDVTLGGLSQSVEYKGTEALPREEGSFLVGFIVDFEIEYNEGYGSPDTPV